MDSEEFRYNATANRLNFNTSQFDHVKDNRIKHWRDQEYAYDAWGNLVEKRSGMNRLQTFTYDCENRLVRAETLVNGRLESNGSYRYDSLGRRVAKVSEVHGVIEQKHFLWQGLRLLREETPGQSSLYVYEPGSYAPLARVDQGGEQRLYYFHTDQIGTPLEMTDREGQIVWQATYKAWGSVEKLTVNEVEQNLRFQGQYFDDETGLHYNTFRYYDPEVGRFVTQDPIGLLGGDNLYSYAPNTNGWIDPWGGSCIPNKVAGTAREARAKEIFGKRYGKQNVLSERYLRTADGKVAKDPLTGEGRRLDFVVKNSDGSGTAKEITSPTADKTGQLLKEDRIREVGGIFVRDPGTKKLIEISDVSTVIRAK